MLYKLIGPHRETIRINRITLHYSHREPCIYPQQGILSHKQVGKIKHTSIADRDIQDRRSRVVVPGARPLHEYANLYICGRNPMLYRRRDRHAEICVLRVRPDVLDLPGVIVTDMNAAAEGLYGSFRPAPDGLRIVDRDLTFAEYWTDSDQIQYYRKKSAKCAEVLVPDRVDPEFIFGCYVSCPQAREQVLAVANDIDVTIDPYFFSQ